VRSPTFGVAWYKAEIEYSSEVKRKLKKDLRLKSEPRTVDFFIGMCLHGDLSSLKQYLTKRSTDRSFLSRHWEYDGWTYYGNFSYCNDGVIALKSDVSYLRGAIPAMVDDSPDAQELFNEITTGIRPLEFPQKQQTPAPILKFNEGEVPPPPPLPSNSSAKQKPIGMYDR
jgi:hypothetical protein